MDPHYLRLRRRQRILRAIAVLVFFGLLSLPVLYLLRGEIRDAAAAAYRFARGELQAVAIADAPAQTISAPAPTGPTTASRSVSPPPPAPQAAAKGQPAQATRPVHRHTAKIGETTFRIPEGYIEGKADLGSKKDPTILVRALLPDLRPRAEGRGDCAPKQVACPDFVVIKLRPARTPMESEFSKRYKTGPSGIALIPGIHGLRQIPPHQARPGDGRQFLAQPAGRWVWITCREFGRPAPKRPTPGICQLAFDTTDGVAVRVRFDKEKLRDWSAIHAKAIALIASLKG